MYPPRTIRAFALIALFMATNCCSSSSSTPSLTNTTTQRAVQVFVNKCCPPDQYMSPKTQYQCSPGIQHVWSKARVYNMRQFLPEGDTPSMWVIRNGSIPTGCMMPLVQLPLRNGAAIPFINGSLMVLELGGHLIHPDDYCLDYEAVMFCDVKGSTATKSRVKKCCGPGGVFVDKNMTCIASKERYDLKLSGDIDNVVLVGGFPTCEEHHGGKGGTMVLAGKLQDGQLYGNGSLKLGEVVVLKTGQFCLEHFLTDNNTNATASIFTCPGVLPSLATSVLRHPSTGYDLRLTIYPIALAIGAIFLAATLAAGCLLLPAAHHHALHWRCQTNHVACLLLGNVLLCVTQLSGDLRDEWTVCFLIAVLMQFLFLAAFFWLNTMCFNIWWTFRDLRPQSLEKSQERWRLRVYEAYAWGGPLLLAGAAAAVDIAPDAGALGLLKPGFVRNSCWFAGRNEILTYFYGPIGALLIMNLVLFAATARELTCGLWKRELVKSTTERAALGRVCMKLVVVMGVSWIADVISWAVGGPNELWYVSDVINCLQGVFIFLVVGLQPQVVAAVKRAWCVDHGGQQTGIGGAGGRWLSYWRRGVGRGARGGGSSSRGEEGGGTTTHHHSTSSSHGLPSIGDTMTGVTTANNSNSAATFVVATPPSTLSKGTGNNKAPLETSC